MQGGVQNTGAEVSELQLMAENQINLEAPIEQDNNNGNLSHTGEGGTKMRAHTQSQTQWLDRLTGLSMFTLSTKLKM